MRKEELAKEMDPEKIKAGHSKHFSFAIWLACTILSYADVTWNLIFLVNASEHNCLWCRFWTGSRGRSVTSVLCCPPCILSCGRERRAGNPWAWLTWSHQNRSRRCTAKQSWSSTLIRWAKWTPNNLQLFTSINWHRLQTFITTLLAAKVGNCHPVSKMCTAKSARQNGKRKYVENVKAMHFTKHL